MTDFRYARRSAILGKSVFDHAPGTITMSSGAAYPPLLPDVVREATEAVGPLRAEAMQYAPLMGLDDLRSEICRFVATDGIEAKPENVLVTYGSKSAFDLALRVFVEPGDRVIVTRPTYMTAIHIMRTHNVQFLDIGQDAEGFDTDELERKLMRLRANAEPMPRLLFDVPDFHNPTGITTSLARRKRMVELARQYNFVICEDDPYRRIRFEGESVPPIKSLDTTGHVISLGTVSKILAPGLRVGWAIGEAGIIRRMALQKADGGSNAFAQRIVVQLMQSNKIVHHVDELTAQMRTHRDAMLEAFAEHLPEARIRAPLGGYFLWAELPEGDDAERIAELGVEEGVEVSTGRLSFPGDGPGNCLRLAYSFIGEDEIRRGIAMLGTAYRRYKSAARAA
ncbi:MULTISPECIES: PLP-dependent aminotransferase family protein [unclassified Roseitalea]|uniref:aminotransferase-like domain-containing protein n=1 Tax=unclassified Roseitalea TaxID=2639107 RepID=UPI00273DA726|nr:MULTISPECIES: PLP-dependent aminotransferase family protein [unclassified Roseitalea]